MDRWIHNMRKVQLYAAWQAAQDRLAEQTEQVQYWERRGDRADMVALHRAEVEIAVTDRAAAKVAYDAHVDAA